MLFAFFALLSSPIATAMPLPLPSTPPNRSTGSEAREADLLARELFRPHGPVFFSCQRGGS